MPFLLLFTLSWAAFWLFADLRHWRRYLPACLLASVMSLMSDSVTEHFPLWEYYDTTGLMPQLVVRLLDDFGVYPVTTYLFLQYMPAPSKQVFYYLKWTIAVILLESLFCWQDWMVHHQWSLAYSYIADWVIFFLLHRFTLLFQKPTAEGNRMSNPMSSVVELLKLHGLNLRFISETEDVEILMLQMEPGSEVRAHTHPAPEFAFLLQGQLEVSVGAERKVYRSGQWITIQGHVVHSAVNIDNLEPAIILSIVLSSGLRQKLRAHTMDQLLLSSEPLQL
ncbi:cupin domain-containing protein [Tumebacillus sp. ITR2]|uniref:Cupin domain-containing protein n=1 Tax=Tumebacillus amylolyticus TaxID=2801339 RepID=A0ABS1J7H8_9BACL|nr:CBO0543 family protein [Tumebacillus amylolyticus]MBL0386160.1 cupin domain-containing protein [Tumebacillus amylolyticus]